MRTYIWVKRHSDGMRTYYAAMAETEDLARQKAALAVLNANHTSGGWDDTDFEEVLHALEELKGEPHQIITAGEGCWFI